MEKNSARYVPTTGRLGRQFWPWVDVEFGFFEQRFTQMADNRFSSDRPFLDYSWAPAAHGGTIHSIDLACNGLRWDAIDDNMARATLTDGDVQVAMTF